MREVERDHEADGKACMYGNLRHDRTPSHGLDRDIVMQSGQEMREKSWLYVVSYAKNLQQMERKQANGGHHK